jgi:hypothetical protein
MGLITQDDRLMGSNNISKQEAEENQKSKSMTKQQDQGAPSLSGLYDTGWKKIVHKFLYLLIEFFFPELYTILDTRVPPEFLDTELQKIAPEGKIGKRFPDVLVKVFTKSREEKWLICHLELQTQPDPHIAKRMYTYSYRIHSMTGVHPISILFLTDPDPHFRQAEYSISPFPGNELTFKYLLVKTLDWLPRLEKLKETDHLAAQILSVYLEIQQETLRLQKLSKNLHRKQVIKQVDRTISQAIQRQKLEFKERVFKRLLSRNLDWNQLKEVLLFLDWLVILPKNLAKEFHQFLHQELSKGDKTMAFISTPERVGMWRGKEIGKEIGKELGKLETAQDYVLRLLQKKFGISEQDAQIVQHCKSHSILDQALDTILSAESLDEVLALFHT